MTIASIFDPIKPEMVKIEEKVGQVIRSAPSGMSKQLAHVLEGGKRVRPALTMLSGKFYRYDMDLIAPAATAMELLHAATLVHDDTIDESNFRRGKPTIGHLWGNYNAVLLGDYLFAASACMTSETGNVRVMRRFAQTLMSICTGEIDESINPFNNSKEYYFKTIGNKTASLFANSAESGAILSEAPEDIIKSFKEYGHNIGMSFQIVDDILDFTGQEEKMGKPVAIDLSRGVFTLPVILFLERHESRSVKELLNKDKKDGIRSLMEAVHKSSVLDECYDIARDLCSRACTALERLPDNAAHDSLIEITKYIIARKE